MKLSTLTLIAATVASLGAQAALAATETPKARAEVKAEAKKVAKSTECYEAGTAPKAQSDKTRAEVKAGAKGAATECEASPAPEAKSTAKRAEVKAETTRAIKAGEVPQGEGGIKK
jgi:uncharacterized protein YgiM (DUF1202 family)